MQPVATSTMALRRVRCGAGNRLGSVDLQSRQLRLPLHGTNQNLPDPCEASPPMASLTWFRVLVAGAAGLLAWRGQLWAIPLSIIVPCLVAVQPTRAAAGAASFAYYAAASLPVIAVAKAYWPSSDAGTVMMWLAAADNSVLALDRMLDATELPSAVDLGHCGRGRRSAATMYSRLGISTASCRRVVSRHELAGSRHRPCSSWPLASREHAGDLS